MTARWLVPSMLAAGAAIIILFAPAARSAERVPLERREGWVITLLYAEPLEDFRTHRELSGPYPTRAACAWAAARMLVIVKGGRLRCDFVRELRMVPR